MIEISPIENEDMHKELIDAMKNADDGVDNPTHAIIKEGSMVGALSFNNVCLQFWMDTSCTPRDSSTAFICMNALAKDRRIAGHVMPCRKDSPYYGLMEKLGYRKVENVDLFYKD